MHWKRGALSKNRVSTLKDCVYGRYQTVELTENSWYEQNSKIIPLYLHAMACISISHENTWNGKGVSNFHTTLYKRRYPVEIKQLAIFRGILRSGTMTCVFLGHAPEPPGSLRSKQWVLFYSSEPRRATGVQGAQSCISGNTPLGNKNSTSKPDRIPIYTQPLRPASEAIPL